MTKERLRRCYQMQREVESLKNRLEELGTKKDGLKALVITGMPTAHNATSQVEQTVISYIELERKYMQDVIKLNMEIMEIEAAITTLEDPLEREVLKLRYIDGLSWAEIELKLNYAKTSVTRIHGKALLHIKDV